MRGGGPASEALGAFRAHSRGAVTGEGAATAGGRWRPREQVANVHEKLPGTRGTRLGVRTRS